MSGLLAREFFNRERAPAGPSPMGRAATELLFQPRLRLHDRGLVAYEASTVRPRSRLFRGQALAQRESREIMRDQALFHEACRWAARWTADAGGAGLGGASLGGASLGGASLGSARPGCGRPGESGPILSLRVSEIQAASGLLAPMLAEIMAETRLGAGRLELEFSEDSLEGDEQELLYLLGGLRDLGVGIAIGGFGAGVSSLTLLRRRCVAGLLSSVRLAAAAVQELATAERRERDYLRSLADCAHALGLTVLAEGVDSEELLECLRESGCDEAVGPCLGEAVRPDETTRRATRA